MPPITTSEKKRSRFGCLGCKKRKRKCDEIKPICTSCLKANRTCQYKSPIDSIIINGVSPTTTSSKTMTTVVYKEVVGETVMNILTNHGSSMINSIFDEDINLDDEFLCNFLDDALIPKISPTLEIKLPVELTENELSYFEFYCKQILPELCILPQEFNFYSKIYVPMAFKEKAVLYSLVSWGCKVLKNNGLNYLIENKEANEYVNKVTTTIEINNKYLTKENFIVNFCCYMALVCMEISFGDVNEWSNYFTSCFNMINKMPGNFKFLRNCSTEGNLLAENFAYFDVLASQSNENGTFYPISDYHELFSKNSNAHDPLQGCLRPIILLIGEIVTLLVEYSSLQASFDLPECDKYEVISNMIQKSNDLDKQIQFTKPDLTCLQFLKTPQELENHLTLFEIFQISAQIYLRQVIKKLPPVVPEIEMLFFHLKHATTFLVKTPLRKNLGFPMLILGVSATSKSDRTEVRQLFEQLIQSCGYMSGYQKLWIVVQKIWDLNSNGTLYVDWYKVTKQFGWRLNLGR